MSELVVSCGGARVKSPASVLRLTPPRANVALRIGGIPQGLASRIPRAFVDLVEKWATFIVEGAARLPQLGGALPSECTAEPAFV